MSKKKMLLSLNEKNISFIKHVALDEGKSVSALMEEYIEAIKINRNTIKAIRSINSK